MKHDIPAGEIGPLGQPMADAVQTCVHCGFCLPTCPTYQTLGQEQDSPRGRILLMKEVLEGNLPLDDALIHIDQCLGCVACETACPSQVKYGELISPFRAHVESQRRRPLIERLKRFLVSQTLPYPGRFRLAMKSAKWAGPLKKLVPKSMRPMMEMVPRSLPKRERLQEVYKVAGKPRARVALLAGCAQQVLAPHINIATINVLLANDVEVVVPGKQVCCGALAWHVGDARKARKFARQNLAAFPQGVDAIVTNAAGCGSGLHDYRIMFLGGELAEEAEKFTKRVVDVSKFLQQIGLRKPPGFPTPRRVAYHDACHLAHAQQVQSEPRALLRSINNLTLLEIRDNEICCGSAGTYNIDQPEIAKKLGRRKAENVLATECDAVVMGNIGCMVQIENHLAAFKQKVKVLHTMQLLDEAYQVN